jgi:hypothetical protein
VTRTSRAALAAAVLLVAGAADARAAAIREVHIGPIPAPLGYSAIVRASGGPFGEQTLDVDLSRGPEDDTYLLGAGLTVDLRGGRIHGPLGPYGTIDLALRPTGPERRLRNPRGCFGPRRRIQNAIATGTIEFAPERTSFGQIRTTASFPARFSTDPAFFCRALPRGPRTDVDLDASADRHDLVSSLDLLRTARGLFATVNADTGEKSTTPVQVRRTLTVRLPRSARP